MNRRTERFATVKFGALAIAITLGLAGCASTSPDEKAAVEDRTATTAPPPPLASTNKPSAGTGSQQPGVGQKPLPPTTAQVTPPAVPPYKDPNNILSQRSVYYDYDSDAIAEKFRPMIQAHGKYLGGNRGQKMLVQGNTDERGSREYNIALGQRRAEQVKRMLVLQGAQESQIEAVSLGKEKQRCAEATESCYAQNRRSDMLYGGEY